MKRKQVIVTVTLSRTDREILKKQADRMGLKFSAYIAWLLTNVSRPQQEQSHV